MARYYYEDARWPWRPDGFLRKFLKQRRQRNEKQITRFARDHRPRALDLGMGYGRNALWLAERGYAVEGWETDRRYLAEARREAPLRLGFGGGGPRGAGQQPLSTGGVTAAG